MNITATDPLPAPDTKYIEPDTFTLHVLNPLVSHIARMGLSFKGSRVLEVRGRVSGEWRSVPVNPLVLDDQRYLVAPRGRTQWVRNLRTSGEGRLRKGRRIETFTASELADSEKPPVLRAYLKAWASKWESSSRASITRRPPTNSLTSPTISRSYASHLEPALGVLRGDCTGMMVT